MTGIFKPRPRAAAAEAEAAAAAAKAAAEAEAAKAAAEAKKPTDEEARLLKENMKRKADLQKATEDLAKVQTQLKQFEGIDVEAVKKLMADQRAAEEKQLEAKGDFDRLKQRMAEEHGKEVGTLKEQLAALQGQLGNATKTIDDLSIGTQFGQSSFIQEELTLTPTKARVIYANHFDVEDGKVVGYDKPRGSASRTALVDQYGTPVGFDAALRSIVEADPEKDHLIKSKVKVGANSDSRKPQTSAQTASAPIDSVSKIAQGLKSLKLQP